MPCQLWLQYFTIQTRLFNLFWFIWLLIIGWGRILTVSAGERALLLGFTAADFLGCSLSTVGNHEQSDLDEEPVAWGSTEWFLGCSLSTGGKLGHSKVEGGSAVSGVTEAEFLSCSLFTEQRLGQSESGKVLVMTGFRDADLFDCASLIRDGRGDQGWK